MPSADPNASTVLQANPARATFPARIAKPFNLVDILAYGFLLAAGAFYFYFRSRASDFLHDDVFYFQRALSILHLGYDGFNGAPETTQPPGLTYLFAVSCLLGGCSYRVVQAAFPVFETLGLLVTYTFFRRQTSQLIAIVICVLVVASPVYFSLATAWIATSFPVFFTSMSTLLVSIKLDEAASTKVRFCWSALAAILVASSMMIASASLSLLGAVVAKIVVTFFRDRHRTLTHLKNYAAVLLLAITVQGLWAHRKPMPIEWPIQGFPRPYVQQLSLKSGPNPELGYATWRDIVLRVEKNLVDETSLLLKFLYPGWINPSLPSVAIAGPILLIFLGWGESLWLTRGDTLAEWYFAAHQVIYLFWPWNLEVRYFFPIAPLAMLYLWRGLQTLLALAENRPRILGAACVPASAILAVASLLWLRDSHPAAQALPGGLQAKLSLVLWAFSVVPAAWMAWRSSSWKAFLSGFLEWCSRPLNPLKFKPLHMASAACAIYIAAVAMPGFAAELRLGKEYQDPHSSVNRIPPDVEAAWWLRSHTAPDAILMSRETPTVSYHSGRKVIWFPPSGNPHLLIEGIRRYKVDYVIVVKRADSYFLPPDDVAMAALLANYPAAFRLAMQAPDLRIFQVLKDNLPHSQGHFFDE
jgi:hypothetical protein